MAKYLANITINKPHRKIVIGIYESGTKNSQPIDVIKHQCKNDEEFNKKLDEIMSEYTNYDQKIHWEY